MARRLVLGLVFGGLVLIGYGAYSQATWAAVPGAADYRMEGGTLPPPPMR